MSVGKDSRYLYAATVQVVDASGFLLEPLHLDLRPTLTEISFADNQSYQPSNQARWSRIAWERLGNGRHWWIIADFSQILDPFSELRPTKKLRYLTQLSAGILANQGLTSIAVQDARKFNRGDVIRVEDLNPANVVSFEAAVLAVNVTTKTITFAPVNVPSIPSAFSRVSRVYQEAVTLSVPTPQRAFFQAMNFNNPMNTLQEG